MTEKEKALKKYFEVFETLMIPIATFDARGMFLDGNPAFCELFGFHRQELIGKMSPFPYWPPEEADHIRVSFDDLVVRGHVKKTAELTFMKKDGTRVPTFIYRAGVRDSADNVVAYAAFFTDVTKRRQAEDALKKSERKFRSLYECILDGIARVAMDGRILDANPVLCHMLGYTLDELKGMTYQQLTPAKWHKMEAELVEKQIKVQGCSNVYEKEYIRKDGTIFPISLNTWLEKDETGKPVGMAGIVRDMTELKKKDAAVAYYKIFMENAGDAIFLASLDDAKILEANVAATKLFGYAREELLTMKGKDLRDGEYRQLLDDQLEELKSGEKTLRSEVRYRTKNKGNFQGEVTLRVVNISGQKTLVAIVRDISERKDLENSLRAKLDEIEKMNKFLSGREQRVIELKRQVDDLLEELGRAKKYNA